MSTPLAPGAVRDANHRTLWIVGGGLGLASLAAAAGLALHSGPKAPPAMSESLSPGEAVVATAAPVATPVPPLAKAETPPAATAAKPHASTHPGTQVARADTAPRQAEPPRVAVCADCGVVESVRTVTHKGSGTGVGAVAGGVLGAVLGNQVGRGNGRKAMTVLGAVGGGLAGNEVEKRTRSTTAYQVSVRMEDGSLRTIEQSSAPAVGARVTVQGNQLKTASPAGNGSAV